LDNRDPSGFTSSINGDGPADWARVKINQKQKRNEKGANPRVLIRQGKKEAKTLEEEKKRKVNVLSEKGGKKKTAKGRRYSANAPGSMFVKPGRMPSGTHEDKKEPKKNGQLGHQ